MTFFKNIISKWSFLLILGIFLMSLFLKRNINSHSHDDHTVLASQSYDLMGDNFSEHLNALTQRLGLVIEENKGIKESHQKLLSTMSDLKKSSMLAVTMPHHLFQQEPSENLNRIDELEQDLLKLHQKIDHLESSNSVESHLITTVSEESFEIIRDLSVGDDEAHFNPKPSVSLAYTLPSGATLASAIMMSALVGRIPIDGSIKSPYPFKIILGEENLIANWFVLPEISGAIVQGYSVGDMSLSCVRGVITELTFLFPDGSIVNTHAESHSIEQINQALGYLSEPDGNPCLSGTFYSNAPVFLGGEIALGALSGVAKGLQFAQEGSQTNPYGSERYFNGHLGPLLMGSSAEEASTRAEAWWAAREKDSFDVVYVPAGQPVVINITQNIQIDHDPQARKLKYEYSSNTH